MVFQHRPGPDHNDDWSIAMADYPVCKIDGCANPAKARGMCSAHYQRAKAGKDPAAGGPVKQISPKKCAHEGCSAPANIGGGSRGFCNKHYLRFMKFGDTSVSLIDREGDGICSVPGCGKKSQGKGLCGMHRQRMRAYGTVDLPERETKLEWLARHARYDGDDCIVWPFAHALHGRGIVQADGKSRSAPNVMARLAHGEPPTPSHEAAHTCGNGHKGCLNPRHLRWATRVENEADKVAHGTLRKGEDINTCKLSPDDVRDIRRRLREGEAGAAVAASFGITNSHVSNIRLGRTWRWLD